MRQTTFTLRGMILSLYFFVSYRHHDLLMLISIARLCKQSPEMLRMMLQCNASRNAESAQEAPQGISGEVSRLLFSRRYYSPSASAYHTRSNLFTASCSYSDNRSGPSPGPQPSKSTGGVTGAGQEVWKKGGGKPHTLLRSGRYSRTSVESANALACEVSVLIVKSQ